MAPALFAAWFDAEAHREFELVDQPVHHGLAVFAVHLGENHAHAVALVAVTQFVQGDYQA